MNTSPASNLPASYYWPCAQHAKVGDVLDVLGQPLQVISVEPYSHPVVTGGERYAIASDAHGRRVTLDRSNFHSCCRGEQ